MTRGEGFNTVGDALARAVKEKDGDLAEVVHHVNMPSRFVEDLFARVDYLHRRMRLMWIVSGVYFVGACAAALAWALI